MFNRSGSFAVAGASGAATLTAASAPSPLYPLYQRLWGFSAFTLTVVFAVYIFALLAALLTVGSLSDRLGRRPVASAALVLLAVGTLLFAVAGGVGGLIVARVVQGVAVGAATGTTTAMIIDTAPGRRRGSVVSSAVPPLGIAAGAVVAGALVEYAPLPRQLVFWVLAILYVILAALIWRTPESARLEPTSGRSRWRSLVPTVGLPSSVRPTFFALLPSMGATWALAGLYLSLGSSILATVLGVSNRFVVGVVLASFFLAGIGGSAVSAALPPRFGEWLGHGTLAVGVLITIAALPMRMLPPYVAGSVIAGFGFGALFRSAVDALDQSAPPARRGQVFAVMYIVSYLAFSVPALAAGLAAVRFGLMPTAIGYGVMEVGLVAGAMSARVARARRRAAGPPPDVAPPASRYLQTPRHTTHYLERGPTDGPLMVFVHGWPGIGATWRAQMAAFATDGWHCVAPDLRGYGRSSAPAARDAYTIEESVADMVELHDHLGGESAIWVGHDWGSIVVGAFAAHQPARCRGAVLTSWAYFPDGNSLSTLVPLVDRSIYPADRYPDGQWDYYRYYTTHFDAAVADLDADPAATLASIYRSGNPAAIRAVSPSATVTHNGGRFGDAHRAPPTEPDPALWPPADFDALVHAFRTTGFGPSCAWYLNDDANAAYARTAPDGGRLSQPILFVNGDFDQICSITGNRQGEPMRAACPNLTVRSLPAGHWLPLECKEEHLGAIRAWLLAEGLSPSAPRPVAH